MAEQKRWTPEDEAAVEASIRNVGRELRERLYMREAAARERRERAEQRRRTLRRFSFGLLGRE
jgi:hypothetical protein